MTSRFELFIFDCDGVLVDSERLSIRVDAIYLEQIGWPMPEAEIVERFVGKSDADMRAAIEAHLGGPVPAEIDEAFERLYRETFDRELEAVEGVEAVLEALAAAGTPLCVASSGTHAKIRRSLAKTGLARFFGDRLFSATDVPNGKPAPDLFLHAAATLGVEPARCAVIEDSVYGVAAALAAGMHTFAYAGGVTPAVRLSAAGDSAVIFHHMAELPGLLSA
ncbi:MAG TPA: HAD family phosphatase [Candidatus Limnocylindrales bacterium]|nr:HAD family phosphatase [Candidatus Limnocylindrales bacterium]